MQLNFSQLFPELPADSRVWIYTSDRVLTDAEVLHIQQDLQTFVSTWSTHGSAMSANTTVLLNRFLIIAADEKTLAASGCSIDSSVRFIKKIGQELHLDFFNRLNVYILSGTEIIQDKYHSLGNHSGRYFDPLTNKLDELRLNWPKSLT